MKVVVFGDIHGRDNWKSIFNESNWDLCIFLGDYFDPYLPQLDTKQYLNFQEILKFREENPGKVILLTGNHDYHYMNYSSDAYSRWSRTTATMWGPELRKLFDEGVLQVAYQIDKTLFIHAGLTEKWYWMKCRDGIKNGIVTWEDLYNKQYPKLTEEELKNIAFELNHCDPRKFCWDNPSWDIYGEDGCSGPFWIRRVHNHGIRGLEQIVGHTQFAKAQLDVKNVDDPSICVSYIDCLEFSGEYLVIENGVKTLKNSR